MFVCVCVRACVCVFKRERERERERESSCAYLMSACVRAHAFTSAHACVCVAHGAEASTPVMQQPVLSRTQPGQDKAVWSRRDSLVKTRQPGQDKIVWARQDSLKTKQDTGQDKTQARQDSLIKTRSGQDKTLQTIRHRLGK